MRLPAVMTHPGAQEPASRRQTATQGAASLRRRRAFQASAGPQARQVAQGVRRRVVTGAGQAMEQVRAVALCATSAAVASCTKTVDDLSQSADSALQ